MPTTRSISEKSTGQLVDELVTNAFKTTFALDTGASDSEFETRYQSLRQALQDRLDIGVASAVHDLCIISFATWTAQEVVMTSHDDTAVAMAARQAQQMNARRTALIREIDRLLGESNITITTKTYG